MGDGSGNGSGKGNKKKKKRSGRGRRKAVTSEQLAAMKAVSDWVSPEPLSCAEMDEWTGLGREPPERVLFELHSHSLCSDGFLSPAALVERAHRRGVKVLALTDHDTMAGIPEAAEAAHKLGIRIIPGVEISATFCSREDRSGNEEPVHILAYYSSCGPSNHEELDLCLSSIREGRYARARDMVFKLNKLKVPVKWEHVTKIAGNGVAPGRLHVARALVEAGYVESLKQAFSRYLYDGGPAYATGSEVAAEDAVRLICRTGGVAALAHPWALKNPVAVVKALKVAGLGAVEVYRSDGKLGVFSDLCDAYGLLKIGGSDYHGRGGKDESDLGSVNLPVLVVHEFLKVARPVWCDAIKDCLADFTENPTFANLESLSRFGKVKYGDKNTSGMCGKEMVGSCISSWLTTEERSTVEFQDLMMKLQNINIG